MNHRHSLFRLGIAAGLAVVCLTVLANTAMMPPKVSEVAGVWSGYASTGEFLRLELDPDGAGYLSVSYTQAGPPQLYRVENWRFNDWNVELKARPIDPDAPAISFRNVRYSLRSLNGDFGGAKWKRQITLYGERTWQSYSGPAEQRIAKYRTNK